MRSRSRWPLGKNRTRCCIDYAALLKTLCLEGGPLLLAPSSEGALSEAEHTIHEEHIAAIQAELGQMKAEHATAHTDRKAKLQEKINQLDSKLQAQLQKAKERREAAEREAQAKAEVLKAKAAAAKAKAAETHT